MCGELDSIRSGRGVSARHRPPLRGGCGWGWQANPIETFPWCSGLVPGCGVGVASLPAGVGVVLLWVVKKGGPHVCGAPLLEVGGGGVLLSHTLASAVPSACPGLASGFGMGPGVSLEL